MESKTIASLKKQVETLEEQLSKVARSLKGKVDGVVLKKFNELKTEKDLVCSQLLEYDELIESLSPVADDLTQSSGEKELSDDVKSKLAKDVFRDVVKQWTNAAETVKTLIESVRRAKEDSRAKIDAWEVAVKYTEVEQAFPSSASLNASRSR